MTVPSFTALAPSYARLWAGLVPTPADVPALHKICGTLIANKPLYRQVAQSVWSNADYWFVIALLDQMEGGGGCNTYLGNGQSLHKVTTEVPAGRGPFSTFYAGCLDALHLDGLDKITAWPIERIAYEFEAWNGWGYLNKPINDPYLVAQSNEYTKGKYVGDHDYDPEEVSQQPGALTILKVLVTLDPSIKITSVISPIIAQAMQTTETAVTTTASAAVPAIDYAQLASALMANPSFAALVVGNQQPVPAAVAPQIDLASVLAHLNLFLPLVTGVLAAIPDTASFAPLVNVAQKTISAADDIITTMQVSPQNLPDVLLGHLADIGPDLQAIGKAFPQVPWLANIGVILTNAAGGNALALIAAAPARAATSTTPDAGTHLS